MTPGHPPRRSTRKTPLHTATVGVGARGSKAEQEADQLGPSATLISARGDAYKCKESPRVRRGGDEAHRRPRQSRSPAHRGGRQCLLCRRAPPPGEVGWLGRRSGQACSTLADCDGSHILACIGTRPRCRTFEYATEPRSVRHGSSRIAHPSPLSMPLPALTCCSRCWLPLAGPRQADDGAERVRAARLAQVGHGGERRRLGRQLRRLRGVARATADLVP